MFSGHRVQITDSIIRRKNPAPHPDQKWHPSNWYTVVPKGTWGVVKGEPRMTDIPSVGVDLLVEFENGVTTYVEPMDLYDPEFPETSPDYEP